MNHLASAAMPRLALFHRAATAGAVGSLLCPSGEGWASYGLRKPSRLNRAIGTLSNMSDDQIFQPGDKVMRVSKNTPGRNTIKYEGTCPQYGQVYCVEDFWRGPQFNVIMLVGFGGWRYDSRGRRIGWAASAFRKVDEIKLILEAFKAAEVDANALKRAR